MIRNINERFGDPVEFDSVEEMKMELVMIGYIGSDDTLVEGVDYEVIE